MPSPPHKPPTAQEIHSEVVSNILSQPLGNGTLADLHIPRELVDRIARRATRASFNERYRIVVPAPSPTLPAVPPSLTHPSPVSPAEAPRPRGDGSSTSPTPNLRILDQPLSPDVLRARQLLQEQRPANRAFRADDPPTSFHTPSSLPPTDLANFRPTIPNFQLLADDGTHEPRVLRLQLTRGTDYAAPGDGGSLDLLRNVAAALPTMPLLVAVERKHLGDAHAACDCVAAQRFAPITLVVQDLPVAQWAHDNGKPGQALGSPFTLLPRYASRGEDGSVFVPGETFLPESLSAAGVPCRRSPLLFQGGNMIAMGNPVRRHGAGGSAASSTDGDAELTLLIGEAEIARNTALNLSYEHVVDIFKAEFGVAHVVVLPATSYHIDLELSVRRLNGGESVALVNDTPAAVRHVLRIAVDALERVRHIGPELAAQLRAKLERGPVNEFLLGMWMQLAKLSTQPGHVLETLSPAFAVGPSDSGVGNLQRVMLALDLLASELPVPRGIDPHFAAVLESFARRERERRHLRSQLNALGLKTAAIPSLSDADRGINYLNGIHASDVFLMPIYGGLFQELDVAAQVAVARALGDKVRVLPILSGESQRREGAVRCAIAYGT